MTDLCDSTNTIRPASAPGQPDLRRISCSLGYGHHGDCVGNGYTWTRLGEVLRQSGQRLGRMRL